MAITTPLLLISILTSLSFMLIGYDNGVFGGLTGAPDFLDAFKDPSTNTISTIVAIYEIGCFFGAVLTVIIGERMGRKRMITIGSIFMLIGAALQASSYSVAQMIVARIVSGIGMGAINSTAPVLQAEVSPKASRGRYVCAQLSVLNLGIMLAYWLDFGTTRNFSNGFSWRFPLAFQIAIILPIFILSFIVKESPRWLCNHGRNEEALEVIAALMGESVDDVEARARYEEIADAVAFENSVMTKSWTAMFRSDDIGTRRRVLIACSVQFFQQLGGINGIIYYAFFIFSNSLGFSPYMSSLMSGFLFTWFFVASFIPWFLIDTLGRRKLLIGSVAVMTVVFICMTGATHQIQFQASNAHAMGIFASVLAFIYFGAFTTGFQATVWCYSSEIIPLAVRARGTALATCCNWIINYAVVQIFPIAIKNIGWKTYIIFSVFNASFLPVMYLFYVETKGRSLEEIDLLFDKKHHATVHEAKTQATISHHESAEKASI